MQTFISPKGNPEVWNDKPAGYFTQAEWDAAHPEPVPTLAEAKAAKLLQIDAETAQLIFQGFEFTIEGQRLHFSYNTRDQQNFADTANAASLAMMGVEGTSENITWKGWQLSTHEEGEAQRKRVSLTLTPALFVDLYVNGALAHKARQLAVGSARKAAVEAATSLEAVEAEGDENVLNTVMMQSTEGSSSNDEQVSAENVRIDALQDELTEIRSQLAGTTSTLAEMTSLLARLADK